MFGSKKAENNTTTNTTTTVAKTAASESSNALNSLVKGTTVEGTISSENDIRVDGTIKGHLNCKAKVIIGPSGFIDGEVRCQSAMIEGKFFGKLRVAELLSIKETAEVVGDVTTDKLLVQPGAIFNVTCNMKDTLTASSNGVPKQHKETVSANGTVKQ
jgi:cytoskeletal protein CcmA (bactofilin family)